MSKDPFAKTKAEQQESFNKTISSLARTQAASVYKAQMVVVENSSYRGGLVHFRS